MSDCCHWKLIYKIYELHRLSPIDVGDSQSISYGDCQWGNQEYNIFSEILFRMEAGYEDNI